MRWQNDAGFVAWLLRCRYAEVDNGKVRPFLSDGLVLYCFEAFLEGRRTGAIHEGK